MAKQIDSFELVDHGIEHPDYFQGCGVAFTDFDDVATGIGNDPADAIDDALEQLACADWDVDCMEKRILESEKWGRFPTAPSLAGDDSDAYYHVSIRVK